jgi:hypothetical protein
METSSTNRTYRRLSKTVSAWKKSPAKTLGLGGQELLPDQAGAAWRRVDTASFKEQPHRARCELVQAGQFTVDAPVAPHRVLRCHPQDQATQFWHRRGPTGLAVRVRPAAFDQVPMPAQQCLRRHEWSGPPTGVPSARPERGSRYPEPMSASSLAGLRVPDGLASTRSNQSEPSSGRVHNQY